MALKRLGSPDIRIRLGRGLDTRPDPTLIPEYGEDADSPLVNVAIQSGARVRAEKGVLQKEEGSAKYGVDTDATTTGQGIAVHKHPVNPYLMLAADGDVKYDSAGDGSVWTDILTGLDATAPVEFAGHSGVTYIANGKDQTQRYTGGSSTTVLPDLPGTDECPPMNGFTGGGPAPYASDNFIHEMDTLGSTIWSGNGATVTLDTEIFAQGTGSVKTVTDESSYGEGLKGDLGSGSEVDLSESDYVGFWLYASNAGGWLQFKMSEDESTWLVYPIRIEEKDLDKWTFHKVDIRNVLTTSRDTIRHFRFTTNATLGYTFYVDQFMHAGGANGEYQYAFSFYDTGTGNEGPIGQFRFVSTIVENETAAMAPARKIVFPSRAIYLPDGADRLRIYRSMAGSTRFYKLTDVTPATNAWSYEDTTADTKLEEKDALVQWPGNCPRAKFLVPRGDRMLHVGGTFVGSRNENTTTAAAANAQVTETMLLNQFGRGAILSAEIKTGTGAAEALKVDLQRQTKGGDWSAPTTVATKTRSDCSSNDTWYRFEFSTTGNADVYFSEKYDFRLLLTNAGANITCYKAWVDSGNYLAYRLLLDASSHVFMTNLNEADKVPPLGEDDAPVNEMTGGRWSINREDGQDIVGGCPHGDSQLFYKNRSTYLWVGYSMDDVDYILVLPNLGLLARRSAVDCDGDAVWLAQDRQVYRFRAGANEESGELSMLSAGIFETLDGLAESTLDTACAMYWRRRYYLFIPEASAGSRCFFYDFDQEAWFPGYDNKVSCIIPYEPDGTHEAPHGIVLGSTYFKVVKFFEVEGDEGSAITWNAKSKALDFGDPSDIHRVRAYRLLVNGTASAEIDTTGTVTFTNGSKTVTGSGTNFANTPGAILGGDGNWYEIDSVDSSTQITLLLDYAGATEAGVAVSIYDNPMTITWYRDRSSTAHAVQCVLFPTGTGIREIDRYPLSTLRGKQLEFLLSGLQDDSTKVHEIQLWLQRR